MTDKVQKIRNEIEKLKSNLMYGACSSQIAMETRCKEEAYNEVLAILDSMQEEPKECMYSKDNFTDEDRKVLCDSCEEECEFNKKEEPVSEDLEEAANFYADTHTEWFDANNNPHVSPAFKAGANWQKQQDDDMLTAAYMKGSEEGKTIMKQHMLEEAYDAYVSYITDENQAIVYLKNTSITMPCYFPKNDLEDDSILKVLVVKKE